MRSIFQNDEIPAGRRKALQQFCKKLSIRFGDYALLDLAFRHRSCSNEAAGAGQGNNERLEFLGDSVLGMATAAFLYADMAGIPEGDMARIKGVVVSEQTLAPLALAAGIDEMLVLGRGEEMSGGRRKPAILADAMEAVIGAYYLDAGYAAAERLVLSLIVPEIRKVQENRGARDYKTLLQEFYQKKYKACPVYELVRKTGPDHDQTFWVSVRLGGTVYGPAQGRNKKSAEQRAAQMAYAAVCGE